MARIDFKYSDEVIAKAKRLYLESDMSFRQLAEESGNLLGQKISLKHLEYYSDRDPDGRWHIQRLSRPANISKEINHLRRIIYEQIVANTEGGFFVTGPNLDEEIVIRLLGQLGDVQIKKINPASADPALVNAYMNILAKSKIELDIGASAKTSREKVLDTIEDYLENQKESDGRMNGHSS